MQKPRLAQLADRIARPFLVCVLLAAGLAVAWWWPSDPGHALMVAVAVLIVTCPCALSLATPVAMLTAAGTLARHGVLVRNLQGLEALAGVDTLVFDKTGTLTRDGMAVQAVRCAPGLSREDAPRWRPRWPGNPCTLRLALSWLQRPRPVSAGALRICVRRLGWA